MAKKRYVQVGIGGRARFYYQAILGEYQDTSELVGFCDLNQSRMDFANQNIKKDYGVELIPTYLSHQFDEMIEKEKPDIVIVTSIDRTHHTYIIRAMELGCDVICEKPMTTDEEKAKQILNTIEATGRKLRVTFNYRYSPYNTKLRELIMTDTIGEVFSVHFEWLLNTKHGADYFRRWHRDKKNSGGLLVHKSTHHFDLVNFWLGAEPEMVFALGDLRFYGRENAEKRGVTSFYDRCYGSETAKGDPFAIDMENNERLKGLYLDCEKEDGYIRDRSVFSDGISIEDTMGVMVRYNQKTLLNYSLNAYLPLEGYHVVFNGSKGRIVASTIENAYINAGGDKEKEGSVKSNSITVYPMFGESYNVKVEEKEGGHGGGDPVLLNDLFGQFKEDPFNRAASHVDGILSIMTGIAANHSINECKPIFIKDLLRIER